MGQGRVNIQRFPGDSHLTVGGLIAQGTHVVQPVRQLDEDHPDVLAHGQDHFAQGFRLLLLPVGKVQLGELGHPVHQPRHLGTEFLFDQIQRDLRAVLHRIVQQGGGDGGRIDHQLGDDARHVPGMDHVRLAAFAGLALVGLFRESIGFFDQGGA